LEELLGGSVPTSGALDAYLDDLGGASTPEEVNAIIEGTVADMGSTGAEVASGAYTGVAGTIDNRIESLLHPRGGYGAAGGSGGGSTTGIASGDGYNGYGWTSGLRYWAEVFGSSGKQGARSGYKGYEVETGGISLGADHSFYDGDVLAGLALTYARTDVESK